jgi:hypothetical protein
MQHAGMPVQQSAVAGRRRGRCCSCVTIVKHTHLRPRLSHLAPFAIPTFLLLLFFLLFCACFAGCQQQVLQFRVARVLHISIIALLGAIFLSFP